MKNKKKVFSKIWSSGPTLIVIAASLWALDGIIRRSLYVLTPIVLVFYEHLIGGLILAPLVITQIKKHKLSKKDWVLVILIALLSGVLGTLFFTTALFKINYIPFSVVFLLQKLQPIFAISAGAILLKEKITKRYIPWAGLALISAYFVTFPNGIVNLFTGSGTAVAALYALGAAALWGISTALSRMLVLRVPHKLSAGLRFILTAIFSLVLVFAMGESTGLSSINFSQITRLVFIALSTGMVALLLYYKGLEKTEAKVSTILELTYPLLAVLIDIFLYKTSLEMSQYLAATVLLYAIYRVGRLQTSRINN